MSPSARRIERRVVVAPPGAIAASGVVALLFALAVALPVSRQSASQPAGDVSAALAGPAGRATASQAASVRAAYARLPLAFEANRGQWPAAVRFVARAGAASLALDDRGATLAFARRDAAPARLRLTFPGSSRAAPVIGQRTLPGTVSYLTATRRVAGAPTFRRVSYRGAWQGVDIAFHGDRRRLEYDFLVAPGADPRAIRLGFGDPRLLRVARGGDLLVGLPGGRVVREHAPVAYQVAGGRRLPVRSRYVLTRDGNEGVAPPRTRIRGGLAPTARRTRHAYKPWLIGLATHDDLHGFGRPDAHTLDCASSTVAERPSRKHAHRPMVTGRPYIVSDRPRWRALSKVRCVIEITSYYSVVCRNADSTNKRSPSSRLISDPSFPPLASPIVLLTSQGQLVQTIDMKGVWKTTAVIVPLLGIEFVAVLTGCASGTVSLVDAKDRGAANRSVKPVATFLQAQKAAIASAIIGPTPRCKPAGGVRLLVY